MFILWMPGGFRLTCYYYRKAYYRAFFLDPPACAVGEPRDQYKGETQLLLFQNIHRYFLYVALVFIVILGYDAIACVHLADGGRRTHVWRERRLARADDRRRRCWRCTRSAAIRCGTWWAETSIVFRAWRRADAVQSVAAA